MAWETPYSLQDPITLLHIYSSAVHDLVMQLAMAILIMMAYIIVVYLYNKSENLILTSSTPTEIAWTATPMIALTSIVPPSMEMLYMAESTEMQPTITLKIIGHQWYWSYEYPQLIQSYDSYMIASPDTFRLLDVDNRVVLPIYTPIQVLTTSGDVIHSWTIPAMAIKIDAIPGRINEVNPTILLPGLYYGQCSEICGMNHSFMPIVLEVTSPMQFVEWMDINGDPTNCWTLVPVTLPVVSDTSVVPDTYPTT